MFELPRFAEWLSWCARKSAIVARETQDAARGGRLRACRGMIGRLGSQALLYVRYVLAVCAWW